MGVVIKLTPPEPSLARMYEAIGRAVGETQIFEAVVAICAEMVRVSKESLAGKETDWLVNPSRFKVATKLLLKQLGHSNDVAPEFEARVAALVDKRHILIHRWFIENGWPGEGDADEIVKLISLAREVEAESRLITRTLAEYILKSSAEFSDVREQLVGIFKNVNVGGNHKGGEARTPKAAQPGAAPDEPRG